MVNPITGIAVCAEFKKHIEEGTFTNGHYGTKIEWYTMTRKVTGVSTIITNKEKKEYILYLYAFAEQKDGEEETETEEEFALWNILTWSADGKTQYNRIEKE